MVQNLIAIINNFFYKSIFVMIEFGLSIALSLFNK